MDEVADTQAENLSFRRKVWRYFTVAALAVAVLAFLLWLGCWCMRDWLIPWEAENYLSFRLAMDEAGPPESRDRPYLSPLYLKTLSVRPYMLRFRAEAAVALYDSVNPRPEDRPVRIYFVLLAHKLWSEWKAVAWREAKAPALWMPWSAPEWEREPDA